LYNQVKFWPKEIIPELLSFISSRHYVKNGDGADQSPVILGRPPNAFSHAEIKVENIRLDCYKES
jgi:hypothetical protein